MPRGFSIDWSWGFFLVVYQMLKDYTQNNTLESDGPQGTDWLRRSHLIPDYSWDMLIRASNPAFSCGRSPVSPEPLSIRPVEGTQTMEMLGFRTHLNPGIKPTLQTNLVFHPGWVPAVFSGYPVTL